MVIALFLALGIITKISWKKGESMNTKVTGLLQ